MASPRLSTLLARNTLTLGAPQAVPTMDYPDGPVLGNGGARAVIGNPGPQQIYHLSHGDFWTDGRGWNTNEAYTEYGIAPLPVAQATLHCAAMEGAPVVHRLDLEAAEWTSCWEGPSGHLTLRSRIDAVEDVLLVEVLNGGPQELQLEIELSAPLPDHPAAELPVGSGTPGNCGWVRRETWDLGRWVCRGVAAARAGSGASAWSVIRPGALRTTAALPPSVPVMLRFALRAVRDQEAPLEAALETLHRAADPASLLPAHRARWNDYWSRAWIDLGGGVLERFWYASHYLHFCANRPGTAAPGLFAFPTQDHPRWNGDYHLNYNFECPYQGLNSSNRSEWTEPYRRAILDFLPEGLRRGGGDLDPPAGGCLYPVGIAPGGAVVHDDYMGQKSCALFATLPFLTHYEATLDDDFLRDEAWPLIDGVATFWANYLKKEDGRYVVRGSTAHEHGDSACNTTYDLGLLRRFFRFLVEYGERLPAGPARLALWKDIAANLSPYSTTDHWGVRVLKESEDAPGFRRSTSLFNAFWPGGGDFTLGSGPRQLELAHNTLRLLELWDQGNSFPWIYPAAVRTGYPGITARMEAHLADQEPRYWVREGDPRNPDRHFPAGWQRGLRPNGTVWHCLGGIETAGATVAIDEMLVQGHEGVVRLFPVWPRDRDAAFHHLRIKGAFLVSASLQGGRITQFHIHSERGAQLAVENPWPFEVRVEVMNPCSGVEILATSGRIIQFGTTAGFSYALSPQP